MLQFGDSASTLIVSYIHYIGAEFSDWLFFLTPKLIIRSCAIQF